MSSKKFYLVHQTVFLIRGWDLGIPTYSHTFIVAVVTCSSYPCHSSCPQGQGCPQILHWGCMSLCIHPPASALPLVLQSAPACWGATSLHALPAAESLEEVQAHYLGMYATQSMRCHDIGYPPVGKLTSRYTHATASQQVCATMVLCQLVSASHTVLAIQMYTSNTANNRNRYHKQSELSQTSRNFPWDPPGIVSH